MSDSSSSRSSSGESSREQLPLSNQEQTSLASSQVPLIQSIEHADNASAELVVQKKKYKVYVNEPIDPSDKVQVSSNKKHRKRCLRCLQAVKIVPRVKKNSIRTSRYTGVNYFPWVLARQFRRPANVFFLAVMIITFTPVSPLDPVTWTAFFLLVLLASVLKEGIEDIIRHQNDKKVNHRPISAWRNGEEIRTRWAKLIPGDILKVRDGEEIPADLVVLSTSQKNGQCYVSTVNLDGESALKTRQAVKTTHPYSEENLINAKMILAVDDPSPSLTSFSGFIQASDAEARTERSALDLNNMLLRGTVLRNTEYAYGVIVYAGKNTKYSLNSKRGASKRSTVEQSYDKYIIGNLIALVVVAFAYAVYSTIFQDQNLDAHWYLPAVTDVPVFGVSIFFTYVALLAVFIPLPLYVTLEVVRAGQFRIFGWENYLYDAKRDFRPVSRSLNLHEDLGQVQYIFSDKTGTLTKNKMILQSLSIGTDLFSNDKKLPPLEVDGDWKSIAPIRNKRFEWSDESLVKRLKALSQSEKYDRDPLYLSLLTIALCHSANVFDKNIDENTDIIFHSNSPDEKALLEAAQNFGFCFMARDFDTVKLNVFGNVVLFTILHTLEFSGERKRMSVIVQDDSGRILLLTKGADAVILSRVAKDQPLASATVAQDQANKMGNDCLRTLVLAYKELDREYYNEWFNNYWKPSIEDFVNRQKIIDKASEIVETDLLILGVTGVEDELQDNVPLTISRLLHAGIKIWVVTGDKQETAFNIAMACNLVHESSTVFLHVKSKEEKGNIGTTLDKIKALREESPEAEGSIDLLEHSEWMENRASVKRVGLVLDGETLEFCLEHYWKEILPLMTQCDSVLVCRASPLQKEKVVKSVKKYDKEAVALAIGDGGNDVSMLHAADVGVGLPGEEGSQALMAADFQIGQFELLDDLVLVKGRYFYLQMCIFMFYFCYKSLISIICRFLYVPFAAWSGTSFLNDLVGSFYQLLFTSVPIILSGIFEEDISPTWLLKYPQLYKECIKKIYFNIRVYLFWMALAIYQGVICWGVSILAYNEAAGPDGKYPGLMGESTVNISYVVVVANLQLARILKRWVYPHHIAVYGSIVAYVIVTIMSSLFRSSALHLIGQWMFTSPTFYLGLVVSVVACLLPEVLLTYIQRNYYPRLSDVVAEKEVVHRHRTKEADELGGGWTELTKRSGSVTKLDKL